MDIAVLIEKLKELQGDWKTEKYQGVSYLEGIDIPKNIVDFYSQLDIKDSVDINGVELLSIEKIRIENEEATPGIVIFPMGYCIVASTLYGDVYCIKRGIDKGGVFIASHDEIYEGLEVEEIVPSIIKVNDDFFGFIEMFINEELVTSFYDL